MWSLFGASARAHINFDNVDPRRKVLVKVPNKAEPVSLPIFAGTAPITGNVRVVCPSPTHHQGCKVELIGQIEFLYESGSRFEFISVMHEVEAPSELPAGERIFNFAFNGPEKPYESYNGINCRLRYFVRFTMVKTWSNLVEEADFFVHNVQPAPEINTSIKLEVGIEDCLHIEFEYNKSKYHLKDVILGKVFFVLVRIKIKHMELTIVKREYTGHGANVYNENETVSKYEIMDGAPVKGESIPVRLFLSGFPLTPTYRNINQKFSVRYFLNLVLVDEEDRRYFKQQEITMWRRRL
eukprot:gnl/Spiro4/21106_TR10295_c0_g1_i1.p1 gnl/Spiro4/21106_TR10295_c0_g1~~gnl/Spiro4/21106_TR10295_c0_g1_i1.p1  ORF type:complete len:296 (-),score=50.41 gnl/Spiro4/21106_TR10295_c0_g1_i1:140-1027(-)